MRNHCAEHGAHAGSFVVGLLESLAIQSGTPAPPVTVGVSVMWDGFDELPETTCASMWSTTVQISEPDF
jgi:hypothetical protein